MSDEQQLDIQKTIATVTGDTNYVEACSIAEAYVRKYLPFQVKEAEEVGFYNFVKDYIPESVSTGLSGSEAIIVYFKDKV